jgi:hypothetical protein
MWIADYGVEILTSSNSAIVLGPYMYVPAPPDDSVAIVIAQS